MKTTMKLSVFALLLGAISVYADVGPQAQHLLWNQDILNIELPLNQEKIIEICAPSQDPSNCQGLPMTPYLPEAEVANGSLQSINNGGILYLTATATFSNQLAEFKLNDQAGTVVLARISASQSGNADRIEILLPNSKSNSSQTPTNPDSDKTLGDKIRWVLEQLYAPQRLLTEPNWIFRVPMRTDNFVPIYRGGEITAMPIASWQSGSEFITAVLLRNNQQGQEANLDFNFLRGQWVAASFFRNAPGNPRVLSVNKTPTDSTTLIVVSSMPFNQALNAGGSND